MALGTARLTPPLVAPLVDEATGAPSPAWLDHHTGIADQLADLRASAGRGTTDGSNAAAGFIGEYLTATFPNVALASNVTTDIGSMPLPAGDWDVSGQVEFTISAGANVLQAWVTDASVTPRDPNRMILTSAALFGFTNKLVTGQQRFATAADGTVYLDAAAQFASGTVNARGTIWARRIR